MSEEKIVIVRPDVDVTDSDALLKFTLGSRLDIHAALTCNGTPAPGEILDVVMDNLKGIESVAIGRMRIKAEEKANELSQNAQSALLAAVIFKMSESNIFEHEKPVARTIPTIPDSMDVDVVPGQMLAISDRIEENIDDFMRRFDAEN